MGQPAETSVGKSRFAPSGSIGGPPLDAGVNGHPSAWLESRLAMEGQGIRISPGGPKRNVPMRADQGGHAVGAQNPRPLASVAWPTASTSDIAIVESSLPRLPREFDGYRILQISDPHFDAAPGARRDDRTRGSRRRGRPVRADRRLPRAERGPSPRPQSSSRSPPSARAVRAADGFVAILGNHDVARHGAPFERLGLRPADQPAPPACAAARSGSRSPASTTCTATTRRRRAPRSRRTIRRPFGVGSSTRRRSPAKPPRPGYALYLCGHCHGGQVCLPGGRPLITHLCAPPGPLRRSVAPWRDGRLHQHRAPARRTCRCASTARAKSPSSASTSD